MTHRWRIPSMNFMGLRLSRMDRDEVLRAVDEAVTYRASLTHCVLNASKVVQASRDVRLKGLLNCFDVINADGMSVVWAARLLGLGAIERITGIDLMETLLSRAAERRYSVFFLGATDKVLVRMMRRLVSRHPGLVIAGAHHGYFGREDETRICETIRRAEPDLLFVGMPTPMKERFLVENRDRLHVPFAMGVGGSFDVLAGKVRRAPQFLQDTGLEWAYRLVQEPRRLWRRYLVSNSRFIWMVARRRLQRLPHLKKEA